ncbi:type I-MYXAN CRISPR-associated protein Cas6/Cmx6 [Tautonia sociabilis]|uniref:Type I-MYXAN CRISPR-associated protein Cas6/Cmx6 n=1 Tax=Tautonia sociabilis TaxID=2080755 RepID=A0A432MDC9_9BACT|nr:type I-MYXAN CRISPR-associated protein Cas6/Cmx6 [Tautonia sociabilis]RUL82180.1 type I-MYXAN CRISPR-associated protein Cas6/Cmx6 [Tautonia sociabilis]
MPIVDLAFALQPATIPLDYGYALFGALSRLVPELHGDRRIGVHPIRGIRTEPRRLTLVPQSRLRIRLPSEEIGRYLKIAGRTLDLDGSRLAVGVPRVEPLRAASRLSSRLVTIGRLIEPEEVATSLRSQLAGLGVEGELGFLPSPDPDRPGQPSRKVIRIKGKRIVGYAVSVSGLTAEDSLRLQEHGLGSRRRMGCGVFVPLAPSRPEPAPV